MTTDPPSIHHIALKVTDVQKVVAFYMDALGLEEIDRHIDGDGLRSVWLKMAGAILMVERSAFERPDRPTVFEEDPPGFHLLALRIEASDRKMWQERLARSGYPLVHETAYTFYVLDPEGNRVGLSSWPEPTAK